MAINSPLSQPVLGTVYRFNRLHTPPKTIAVATKKRRRRHTPSVGRLYGQHLYDSFGAPYEETTVRCNDISGGPGDPFGRTWYRGQAGLSIRPRPPHLECEVSADRASPRPRAAGPPPVVDASSSDRGIHHAISGFQPGRI